MILGGCCVEGPVFILSNYASFRNQRMEGIVLGVQKRSACIDKVAVSRVSHYSNQLKLSELSSTHISSVTAEQDTGFGVDQKTHFD